MSNTEYNFGYGRSGCKFFLHKDRLVLQKISKNSEYNNRLLKQFEIQKQFKDVLKFTAPKVYNFCKSNNLWSFDMDYIHGNNFSEFCEISNISNVLDFCDEIINFIKINFENSIDTEINFSKLESKLIDLNKKLPDLNIYFKYLLLNPVNSLKIGKSHGDFTLSNIIFSNKYYLIDFLDNTYESPLNDLIKIKQDSEHKFYLLLSNCKNNKTKISLDYLNNLLNIIFADIINESNFIWFSIFNLLKILPYLKNKKEINFILKNLKKYECYITSSW